MKKILSIITLVLILNVVNGQKCLLSNCSDEPNVTAGVMIDCGLKFYKSGFSGKSIHAGIWAQHLGVFAGYVESKLNDSATARRDGAVTIAFRIKMFDDHVCVVPFFSAGTNNYQDFGIRVGVKMVDGIYIGLMASRTIHYGATVIISMYQ